MVTVLSSHREPPAAEINAAAVVGLQLARHRAACSVKTVQRFSDSSCTLDLASFRARVNANAGMAKHARTAWAFVGALTKAGMKHIQCHASDPGNEGADTVANA